MSTRRCGGVGVLGEVCRTRECGGITGENLKLESNKEGEIPNLKASLVTFWRKLKKSLSLGCGEEFSVLNCSFAC
jgi:hypothetical protein